MLSRRLQSVYNVFGLKGAGPQDKCILAATFDVESVDDGLVPRSGLQVHECELGACGRQVWSLTPFNFVIAFNNHGPRNKVFHKTQI